MHSPEQPDEVEIAFLDGAVAALRKRAALQRQRAAEGTSTAGEKFPSVVLRSPEAAFASILANDWDELASAIEAEGRL